ncbi:MAG: N-acetylgalactosamine 6-sulfate sulfatase, partial [Bacteroidota bacterium]
SVDEGGVRSPMIMYAPSLFPSARIIPQISSVMDLFPTLLDIAGLTTEKNKPLDGQSLLPLLKFKETSWPDRMLVNHWRGKTSIRSQQYRLDAKGQLFDMESDPGQTEDIATSYPHVYSRMDSIANVWEATVLTELPAEDKRPFLIGHPDHPHTQIPARDGTAHGEIKRSNRWPNCSFFTQWTTESDSISWDVDVMKEGDFAVELYYTLPKGCEGVELVLKLGDAELSTQVQQAFDPPLRGMEHDRIPRGESYVKNWQSLDMGIVHLPKGSGRLRLTSPRIPGPQGIDFRLVVLHRQKNPA